MTFKINNFHKISFWVSLISVILILLDVGFSLNGSSQSFLSQLYWVALGTGLFSLALRYKKPIKGIKKKILFFDAVLLLLLGTAFLSLFLSQLEAVGFSLVPEHPLWVTSNHYGDFISTKYNISYDELYKMLSPAFKNPTMTEKDVKNYAINCTQILLTENKSSL